MEPVPVTDAASLTPCRRWNKSELQTHCPAPNNRRPTKFPLIGRQPVREPFRIWNCVSSKRSWQYPPNCTSGRAGRAAAHRRAGAGELIRRLDPIDHLFFTRTTRQVVLTSAGADLLSRFESHPRRGRRRRGQHGAPVAEPGSPPADLILVVQAAVSRVL